MKITHYPLALALLVVACGPSDSTSSHHEHGDGNAQSASVEQLEKDVFAAHDEVMPRIGDIMKLKKELTRKLVVLDSLQKLPGGSPTATVRLDEQQAQARLQVRHLAEADSLMMSWMNNYKGDTLKVLSEADAARYLTAQKESIDHVKGKINQSISDARTYLKQ